MTKHGTYGLIVITLLAVMSALWSWYHPKIVNVPGLMQTIYEQVEVPKPYKVISTVTVTVDKIIVMDKEKVITVEKWPSWFTGDVNQQLTAIGIVEPYKGKTECASVLNVKTGESQILTKRLPVPLFGFENNLRMGLFVGNGLLGSATWDFVRVGSFYSTVNITAAVQGSDKVFFGGVGVVKEF